MGSEWPSPAILHSRYYAHTPYDTRGAGAVGRGVNDFADFLRALLAADVRFMVVGAHALQVGLPPYRIDILTAISGVDFEAAWSERVRGEVAGVLVPVIGTASFVANKRAGGRTKDLADIEHLESRGQKA